MDNAMKNIKFIPKWLIVAAALTALTIFIHEIAHYVTALAFGAENVKLHWLDVSYDPASLSRMAAAMTALAGPFSTYLIIIVVWLSGISGLAPLALGIGAASRNLVLLPFALKMVLGHDISSFSNDEVRTAIILNISPLPFGLIAVLLGVGGMVVFLRRAYRTNGVVFPIALIVGTALGIILWSAVGPVLFSGGRGFA